MRHFDGAITAEHLANGKEKSAATTQLVSKITLSNGRTISYKYDEEERINKVIDSLDGIIVYDYDALGQLKTETVNGTVVNAMSYDNYGNITEKNGVAYTYDTSGVWKDLLTQVGTDESGKIEYDANGNPIKYLGHDLDWEKGRQLKSFDGNTYTYNANGIRTSKTVDGVMHTYTLDGAKILRETWGENTLIPLYDNEDSVCGILYNGTPYYFIKNLQGDVIAIVDKDAEPVAKYTYDAWGAITSAATHTDLTKGVDIATINPFRYRGYYFDEEIDLYYLQSRYYDASVGRFINADDAEVTTHSNRQQNSFAYCANNGIVAYDTLGYFPVHLVVGTVAGFIWGIAPRLLKMILFKQRAKLSDVLCDGLAGAVGGLITAATGNSTLGTFLGTFVGEVVRYFVQERPFSSGTSFLTILINIFVCLIMAAIAALASFIAGKLVNKITKKGGGSMWKRLSAKARISLWLITIGAIFLLLLFLVYGIFWIMTGDSDNTGTVTFTYGTGSRRDPSVEVLKETYCPDGIWYVSFSRLATSCGFSRSGDAHEIRYIVRTAEDCYDTVIFYSGSRKAVVNGIHVTLSEPVRFINGDTMVPCEFITEHVSGMSVEVTDEKIRVTFEEGHISFLPSVSTLQPIEP